MFTGDINEMYMADPDTFVYDGVVYMTSSSGEAYIAGYNQAIKNSPRILDQVSINGTSYKVTSIGERAFADCKTLESVTIQNTVNSIEKEAFYGCTGLTSVTIPDSVTSIEERAFKECKSLPSVTIPASVTFIGECVFTKCDSLEKIEVVSGNKDYCSVDGVLFTKDMKTLMQYPPSKKETEYSIPDTVTSVNQQAFRACNNLVSIAMPESLTFIDAEAFENCQSLASLSIPSKLTTISFAAFFNCPSLTSIVIPDTVTAIEAYAFANCTGLKTIYFGNGLTSVDPAAFGILVEKHEEPDEFTPTKFYDKNGNEISLSDIEKFKGKAFAGDISEMKMADVHTVTIFDGTTYRTYTGCVGVKIPRPADPTRDGYVFLYWADEDGNEFDWTIPAKDIKVTAVWKSVSPSGDDDDDDDYPSHDASDDSDSMNKKSDDSTKVLIAAACVAAFMALLLAFTTYETKR